MHILKEKDYYQVPKIERVEEELVQEIEENSSFNTYVCLYPKGNVFHNYLVDLSVKLNAMPYTFCCKNGLIFTMVKEGTSHLRRY